MNSAGPAGHPASPWPGSSRFPGTRVTDSALYGHLWGTAEARAILGEEGRLAGWLEVLAALARAQAAAGLIPASAAALITSHARPELIDVGYAAEQTRLASHSMLGLIRALQAALPTEAGEYVYVGATVQDITDTTTALALRGIGALAWRDLRRTEELLLDLAARHRSTVMAGRTHGQAGSPVTFGWKAASWADEIRRHLDRLAQGAPRWLAGQLGGGTGSLVYYGELGLQVRATFCAELGLADPGISWLSSRDRIAEFGAVPGPNLQAEVAVVDQAAGATAKLADQPARGAVRQPVQVAPDLIGPGRGLPAEGHRAAGLAVGAPGHDRGPVPVSQADQQLLDPPQFPPGERADAAQRQRGGGVGDVLHGGADVDILAGVFGQRGPQRPDQAEHGVRGQPGLLRRVPDIDQAGAPVLGDERGRVRRDQPCRRLRPGQGGKHLQPSGQPTLLAEDGPGLGGAPQVPVQRRVGDPRARQWGGSRGSLSRASRAQAR